METFEQARVTVKQGILQGYTDGRLKIFKGIPFAAPPVGARRFRRPEDPERWRGVRQATQYSAAAIQFVQKDPEAIANVHGVPQLLARSQYEEDCLYLNIWSPARTQEDRLPVFIWVHGGGMVAGSGVECVCDGDGFANRRDVIVVTINYRLGFFGFFAHPELTEEGGGTSGNYALFDIVKACEWVRDNISAFGGDAENITLAGQSGGAAAVGALLATPLLRGIIQHVSIESGPILDGFMQPVPREQVEENGVKFMEQVGAGSIAELRNMDAWDLFDAYTAWGNPFGFTFCVDGKLLPDKYSNLIEQGKFNDFDVMIGSCAQEFPVGDEKEGLPIAEYEEYLKKNFGDNLEQMKKWYPCGTPLEAAKSGATIASDIMLLGSIKLAQYCSRYGRRAYVWLMNKENETERGHRAGSPHCAEMPYVFGRVDKGERNPFFDYHWVGADYDFMELVQGYWASFCRNGDPNGEGRPQWKQYRSDYDVLLLGNDTHMFTQEDVRRISYLYQKRAQSTRKSVMQLGRLMDI